MERKRHRVMFVLAQNARYGPKPSKSKKFGLSEVLKTGGNAHPSDAQFGKRGGEVI
jgi:hypothetical protein